MKTQGNSNILIVVLYVDNLLYTNNNEKMIADFNKYMIKGYEMNDIGLLHHFLGMETYQYNDGVFICQKYYCEARRGCKPMNLPLVLNENLLKKMVKKKSDTILYRTLMGNVLDLKAT